MLTLSVSPIGLSAQLLDNRGKPAWYRIDLNVGRTGAPAEWAVRLLKDGDKHGYVVHVSDGIWWCECKAFQFRRDPAASCKHCVLAAELMVLREFFTSSLAVAEVER